MVRVLKTIIDLGIPDGYAFDVERIQTVMYKAGFPMSRQEAYSRWEAYSDSLCAGWLMLPKDDNDIVINLTEWEDDSVFN